MTILRQTSQDTVLCIIGSQSFDIGEMFLIRSTESQILSLPDFISGFFHLHQKFIEGNGSPDSLVNIVFEFSLPTVASFVFHIFFIGFCFLSGGHGLFQTIFPANAIAEFTDLVIVPFVGNVFVEIHKICCVKNQMTMDVILINVSGEHILMFSFQRCISNFCCNFMSDIRICDFTWFEGNDHVPGKVVSLLHHIVFSHLCSHSKCQIGSFR